jgi:hypothetical protein
VILRWGVVDEGKKIGKNEEEEEEEEEEKERKQGNNTLKDSIRNQVRH